MEDLLQMDDFGVTPFQEALKDEANTSASTPRVRHLRHASEHDGQLTWVRWVLDGGVIPTVGNSPKRRMFGEFD